MSHHSISAARKVVRMIAAVSGPLLTVSLSNLASAGGLGAQDTQPALRGSYCQGSDQDLAAPVRAGCARISGYITAGARFESDRRVGGSPDPFASLDAPGMAGARSSSGLVIVGAPFGGSIVLPSAGPGDIAR
jgi:hypothetical protein